jgi:hypothetical protein
MRDEVPPELPIGDLPKRLFTLADIPTTARSFPAIPTGKWRILAKTVEAARGVMLAVASLRNHMTTEGWQLQAGLNVSGFPNYFANPDNDVKVILGRTQPRIVIIQDRREWFPGSVRGSVFSEAFKNVQTAFVARPEIMRLTVFKDVASILDSQYDHHRILMPHLYITYYHPVIVAKSAPWVRAAQCIRTYHSIDAHTCPMVQATGHTPGTLLSGAMDPKYYPLRVAAMAWSQAGQIPELTVHPHPGYHAHGNATPDYLKLLTGYKVHLATASRFGFALRKIIESVACGCTPVTTLPVDEVLPEIDEALVRVPHNITPQDLRAVLVEAERAWDYDRANELAARAKRYYGHWALYADLAKRIKIHYALGDQPCNFKV